MTPDVFLTKSEANVSLLLFACTDHQTIHLVCVYLPLTADVPAVQMLAVSEAG